MKWIKYIAIPLIVLIFGSAMALVIVLATLDDDDYLRIAQRLVFKTTGTKLAVAGEFKVALGWETVLQAQGVTLADPNRQDAQLPLADLQAFKIKVALWPLIHKTLILKELVISDAVITLLGQPESMDSARRILPRAEERGSIPFFLPVIEQMQINRVAIFVPRRNSDIPLKIWIERFQAEEKERLADQNQVELEGQGRIDDLAYRIKGSLGTIATFLNHNVPFPMDVTVEADALAVRLSGFIKSSLLGTDMDLQIACQSPELSEILKIIGLETPLSGKVDLHASLTGSVRDPHITDLKLNINNPSGLNLTTTGAIWAPLRFQQLDLALAGTCRDPALLAWLLPETVPPVEVIELKGFLKDRQRSFYLQCAPLTLTGPQGARLVGNGNIWVGRLQGVPVPKNQIDLQLVLQAPSVAAPFEPDSLPDVFKQIGPVEVTGTLKGLFTDLALDNVTLLAGGSQTNTIEANGAIDRIRVRAEHPVSGVLFKGNVTVTDPALLVPDHAAKLSSLGSLSSGFTVKDTNGTLNLSDMVVRFKGPPHLEVAVKGSWSALHGTKLELNTRTSAADLKALPGQSDIALPDFNAIDLQVSVAQQNDRWDVTAFEARGFGAKSEVLEVKGNISDLFGIERTILTIELAGDLTQDIYPRKGPRFDLLKQVQGQAVIGLDQNGYKVEKLSVECEGLGNLSAQATGTIKPVKGSYSGNLQVDVQIADPQVLISAYGVKWPQAHAIHINGNLTGNDQKPAFSGQVAWGENQMTTNLVVDLTGPRPRIEIDADAKAYKVTRIERRIQAKTQAPKKIEREKTSQPRRLFSAEPLDLTSIKNLDLLLRVKAGKMSIAGLDLANVDFNFSQVGGHLTITPLTFNYAGGDIDLNFALDASKQIPDWEIDLKAGSINTEKLLTDWYGTADLGGELNLAMNLKSQGKSPRDIAAALTGGMGYAVEQGWVPRNVDLMAADVFDALLTLPTTRKRTDLNCMVISFTYEKGIGTSRILSMDTDDFSAIGGGKVDLRDETIELLIKPKQKKRLVMSSSSPVYIFGSLSNPSFSKKPYQEAAKLLSDLIIPLGISDRVLSYLWEAVKPAPNEVSPCYVAPGDEE